MRLDITVTTGDTQRLSTRSVASLPWDELWVKHIHQIFRLLGIEEGNVQYLNNLYIDHLLSIFRCIGLNEILYRIKINITSFFLLFSVWFIGNLKYTMQLSQVTHTCAFVYISVVQHWSRTRSSPGLWHLVTLWEEFLNSSHSSLTMMTRLSMSHATYRG